MTLLTAVQLAVKDISLFKRPTHINPFVVEGRGVLKEIYNQRIHLPKLTVEDIAANDWRFV